MTRTASQTRRQLCDARTHAPVYVRQMPVPVYDRCVQFAQQTTKKQRQSSSGTLYARRKYTIQYECARSDGWRSTLMRAYFHMVSYTTHALIASNEMPMRAHFARVR